MLSGIFVYSSLLIGQAPHGGWFAYVPYTDARFSPGFNIDFYALSLIFLTISATAGAINFLVTIFQLRAPGMRLGIMPLFTYSTGTTSALVLLALPALTVALVSVARPELGHAFLRCRAGRLGASLAASLLVLRPSMGLYRLPPATGMISMIVPMFTRRPIVGYAWIPFATMMTGLVGFGVWFHHMFATGMSDAAMSIFSAASLTLSVFSTIQVFAWLATLWRGRPVVTSALRFALGFIALFIMGGLSGVITALIPFDWQLTDSYFVVAHLHYVLIGANVFPVFAALYYWLPR